MRITREAEVCRNDCSDQLAPRKWQRGCGRQLTHFGRDAVAGFHGLSAVRRAQVGTTTFSSSCELAQQSSSPNFHEFYSDLKISAMSYLKMTLWIILAITILASALAAWQDSTLP